MNISLFLQVDCKSVLSSVNTASGEAITGVFTISMMLY